MADIYVRSTDGNNGDSGATWALAKATIVGAAGIDAAGDTIWLSQSHSESTVGSVSPNWAGTLASPTRVLCGNDAAEPPTALAAGAVIAAVGDVFIQPYSGTTTNVLFYGITFRHSGGSSFGGFNFGGTNTKGSFYSCVFECNGTVAGQTLNIAGGELLFVDCDFKFGHSGQSVLISSGAGTVIITDASLLSGGTSPTTFTALASASQITFDGLDLSNASSSINLASVGAAHTRAIFRNAKLPASWSGELYSGTRLNGSRISAYNCDSADTNYRLWIATLWGDIRDETTLVRTGGASDSTTPISWKLVSTAGTIFRHHTLITDEIVRWNETIGSAITVTVEILHDPGSPGSLNDDEIWLEVQYLGTSGVPLGSFIDDAKSDVLAAAAPQTSSSATWTTTGMSNPTTQKLSVTFTPQEVGFIHAVVKMAKPSYTVYVCPKLDVT